ncbi:hypothetical protein O7598_23705 [Micromonospora sp. WMMC241]|uniref:hypothetical protein n=1 Tax=Micromonospora sp. WMMC241 TaxID=3015159 RepID=UPI0022B72864|nr:hypothetical protein [Micromonospora sp. WMMC241]MCZ7439429.1 hypothetical protein [Micromonospora sp. WMMC241]
MQPEGPYRFTETLGECQVGRAWAALDGQDRPVTVAVLEGAAAGDQRWREAFSNAANMLAQTPGGHRYVNADFAAAEPWIAYPSEEEGAAERLFRSLGMDYQRTPTAEMLPPPPVAAPVSPPPQMPWVPQPWAMSSQPISGAPMSPVAVAATSGVPATTEAAQATVTTDPLDPSGGRRIAPVRAEPKRRDWISIVGALVLTLVAGTAGFFLGGGRDTAADKPSPSASPSLPPYEATQFSINKAKFEGELATLAEPWLTRIGGCVVYAQPGAPKLPADEKGHVFCHYDGAWLHFALYPGQKQKDTARAYRQQLNLAGGALAPGLREASTTQGGVTGRPGNYVEYAFEGEDGRAICGVWWDPDDTQGAFYIETLCKDGMAGNWDALRDLWRRGS